MPVLAFQLATGGSEANFGQLRFSLGAGHPVNQAFHGSCSIYYGRFANASGRPSIVHLLTKDLLRVFGAVAICAQKL